MSPDAAGPGKRRMDDQAPADPPMEKLEREIRDLTTRVEILERVIQERYP